MQINDIALLTIERKGKKFVLHNQNNSYWLTYFTNLGGRLVCWRYEDTIKLHATRMKHAVAQMDIEIARIFSLT